MRLGIVGSQGFRDKSLLEDILKQYLGQVTLVVSGGAVGADSLGAEWADKNGIEKLIFLPDWKKYGRAAGFIRNTDIIENSDMVIAFWDGKSHGTEDSINKAKETNKPIKIIRC